MTTCQRTHRPPLLARLFSAGSWRLTLSPLELSRILLQNDAVHDLWCTEIDAIIRPRNGRWLRLSALDRALARLVYTYRLFGKGHVNKMLDLLKDDNDEQLALAVRFPGNGRHLNGKVARQFAMRSKAAWELDYRPRSIDPNGSHLEMASRAEELAAQSRSTIALLVPSTLRLIPEIPVAGACPILSPCKGECHES